MTIQQFRVTLSPSCTIDVCGNYTPMEALQAARDAMEGCYDGRCEPVVKLCVAGAGGKWERFDNVTPGAAKVEAVAKSDAELSNAGLPTYTELLTALRIYKNQILGADYTAEQALDFIKSDAADYLKRAARPTLNTTRKEKRA